MNDINRILKKYPKKKPPLSNFYIDNYDSFYDNNRNAKSLVTKISSLLERWMHLVVSKRHKNKNLRILEIGAGTLNHLQYEGHYQSYDIVEPYEKLYNNSSQISNITNIYKSIYDIPREAKYDVIISVATLEHVEDLPEILVKISALMNNNPSSSVKIAIPSEGGLLWYLSWRFGTGLGFWFKYGKSYKPFMNYEHINTSHEIESLMRYFFKEVSIKRFPFSNLHFSLYTYIEASIPNDENINDYLNGSTHSPKI